MSQQHHTFSFLQALRPSPFAVWSTVIAMALGLGISACDDDDSDDPAFLNLSASVTTAAPCSNVSISVETNRGFQSKTWRVDGYPLLYLEKNADGTEATFRAPVVNMPTDLNIVLIATDADGNELRDATQVSIEVAQPGPNHADGMASDCAPFIYGVASGDPQARSVMLWTSIEPPLDPNSSNVLNYVVATDAQLQNIVASGNVTASAGDAYTTSLEITGLEPDTTYYYQFSDSVSGIRSVLGRTKTAPEGPTDHVRILSMSCSSIYSGYFNSYARIAEVEDVDLVMHMGDYLYDFVDPDETVRVPAGEVVDPSTVEEWRDRYKYYLSDPDFRRARQMHPWMVMWDNHDPDQSFAGSSKLVFREFIPTRVPDPSTPGVMYRDVKLGDLAHIIMADQQYAETTGAPGENLFGEVQWQWLEDTITNSDTAWRVFGTQKLGVPFEVLPAELGIEVDLGISGYEDEPWVRDELYGWFGQVGDNLYLSGDMHFVVVADMVSDPRFYNPETGEGAVGGELLAASVTRGNFDETLCSGLCGTTETILINIASDALYEFNPHMVYNDPIKHGYGLIDITPDAINAQIRFTRIRELTRDEFGSIPLVMERGANHWKR